MANKHDPKVFPNPHSFIPERWLEEKKQTERDIYSFLPFSAGKKNCIGQHLAKLETKLIVSMFVKRFDFTLIEGFDLKMISRFLYEPEQPIFINLKKRN